MEKRLHELRLARVENPPGIFAKFLYFVGRRIFKTVPGAFSVVYGRKPALAKVAITIERTSKKLAIDDELQLLIRAKGSHLRGCAFCHDLTLTRAFQNKLGLERFAAIADHDESDLFTASQKVALDFVEQVCRQWRVNDETWNRLQAQYSEAEIVEILWVNATEAYFNSMAVPLGIPSDGLLALAGGPDIEMTKTDENLPPS